MKKETINAGAAFIAQVLSDPQVIEALMPIFAQIGARIAEQTASRIKERHASDILAPKDAVIPAADCAKNLGISMPTFKKHFIATGLLALVPAPGNADRRMQYVSASAFNRVIAAVPMKVLRINNKAA